MFDFGALAVLRGNVGPRACLLLEDPGVCNVRVGI